jgi:hypothetical protein
MPIYGDLRTVSLTDLLRWASQNAKTGVLEVERNAICRRVEFRKGWVGSCSSNHPSALLGQFLLARGRLNEVQLQNLLMLQKVVRKRLGLLVVEMGFLTRVELAAEVAVNAQQTIHSLFDWDDAFFRFDDGATLDPDQIEVNLAVDDLIAEGSKRSEKLARIRETLQSSGVVLARTEREIPQQLLESPATVRIIEAVDGQRTIAEILLHTRSSEFLVLQLLCGLLDQGLLRAVEVHRTVSQDLPTLLDTGKEPAIASMDAPLAPGEVDRALGALPIDTASGRSQLEVEIEAATRLLERHEYEPAVELLRVSCREHATDYVRRLLARAEAGFVESLKTRGGFTSKVPVLLRDRKLVRNDDATPEEAFLLSMIDGTTDVQSILWLAPLREVDGLMALRRMVRKQMIDLAEPVEMPSVDFAIVEGR